jgi:hypothetical protein
LTSKTQDRVIATSFKATKQCFEMVREPWMDPTQSFFLAHVQILELEKDQEYWNDHDQEEEEGEEEEEFDHHYNTSGNNNSNNNDDDVNRDQYYYRSQRKQQQYAKAEQLFAAIPTLVEQWKALMFQTEWSCCTPATLAKQHQLQEIGTIIPTTSHTDRAFWVAALLNPVGMTPLPPEVLSSSYTNPGYHTDSESSPPQHHRRLPLLPNTTKKQGIMTCPDIRPDMLECRTEYDRLVVAVSALQSSCEFLQNYWKHLQQQRPKRR